MSGRQTALMIGAVVLALALGWWGRGIMPVGGGDAGGATSDAEAKGVCPDGSSPRYWKAPMDPTYVRTEPGKSPMGMDLVPVCDSNAGEEAGQAVRIDPSVVQTIGVQTTQVERRDVVRVVRAVGRVATDERRVAHVHTKVQGWVEKLFVEYVGQEVKRGQPMFEIYSPELVATQEELLIAAGYREVTEMSPFEDVRSSGISLFEATRRRLALWDVPEREIDALLRTRKVKRTITLYAPVSGYVTRLGVRSGMEVQPNANLYTIADLSRVWVLAEVYEYELPWLEVGQRAVVELSYRPGEPVIGELTYIAPFLDPETRTAEVRLEVENQDGRLKPKMFGNVMIEGAPYEDVLVIPNDAVIRSGRRTVVIVALGEGRFEPRDIGIGLDSGDGWLEVRSGLDEGERIVVSGQFLIDSESNLQEAVRKLLADPPRSGADGADGDPSGITDRSAHTDGSAHADVPDGMDHAGHADHAGGVAP